MRSILRLVPGLLLALGLTATAFAAPPDGQSPSTAFPLSTTHSGTLTGSTGGAFAYYTFSYPGDGSQGTITLSFSPGDQATANGFGVSLWQAGSLLATTSGLSSTLGANSLTFSSTTPGPILAQVYNYNPGVLVSYQIGLSGVSQSAPAAATPSAAAAAAPAPAPSATPAPAGSASNPIPLKGPATDMLPGNLYGSFAYYTFDYPGDGSTQSVTLNFSPSGAEVANAVFVTLYQNGAQLAAGQGTQTPTPGQLVVSFSSTNAGPVLVQLANYNLDATISYTISH